MALCDVNVGQWQGRGKSIFVFVNAILIDRISTVNQIDPTLVYLKFSMQELFIMGILGLQIRHLRLPAVALVFQGLHPHSAQLF